MQEKRCIFGKLPCEHFYCFNCIKEWQNKGDCPSCRKAITEIQPISSTSLSKELINNHKILNDKEG
jgi:hypothetical protein